MQNQRIMKRLIRQKGMTLIELLVVVAIISILAAIALPQYQRFVLKSQRTAMLSLLNSLGKVETAHYGAYDEFAPRRSDVALDPTSVNGPGSVVMDRWLNLIGMPDAATLAHSSGHPFNEICFTIWLTNIGGRTVTSGYAVRVWRDVDRVIGESEAQQDTYLVRDQADTAYVASYPGPNDGTAFQFYDDLWN